MKSILWILPTPKQDIQQNPLETHQNSMVKTSLRFYESDIFHIKGLELFKEQNDEL